MDFTFSLNCGDCTGSVMLMNFCLVIQSNPENTVGVLTMAGKGVRVLVTPTSDLGKILACMHGQFLFLDIFVFLFLMI